MSRPPSAPRLLAAFAHPDDAEFLVGGTLFHVKALGWEVEILTLAKGDCGSAVYGKEEIARLVRTAAFSLVVPLFETRHLPPAKPGRATPALYYADPLGGRPPWGNGYIPSSTSISAPSWPTSGRC